jgi:hypothetical protein
MYKLVLALATALNLAACAMDTGDPTEVASQSEALKYKVKDYTNRFQALTFNMATPLSLGPSCPGGAQPYSLSYPVCLDPVQYNCTAYYCNDANGHPFRASMPPGRVNPECEQAQMQTVACSSNPQIPEKYIPSREDLVDRAPGFFPRELLTVPLK